MPSGELAEEISRRRTFAIISHPDAGKTTLTEKLLLFGGAIQMAGAVKGRKATPPATSDWMRLEQQRGISGTSPGVQFPFDDCIVNLLDTPGHEEFSQETHPTLTAVELTLTGRAPRQARVRPGALSCRNPSAGVLRFGRQQLRCPGIAVGLRAAFSRPAAASDAAAPGRRRRAEAHRLRLQDSGQHGSRASRPHCI